MAEQRDFIGGNLEYLYVLTNNCITYTHTHGFTTTGHIVKNLSEINTKLINQNATYVLLISEINTKLINKNATYVLLVSEINIKLIS